jgi:hypothetical protein
VALAHAQPSRRVGRDPRQLTPQEVLRKTLYYRLSVEGHLDNWRAAVTDALAEFPGVRAAVDRL